MKNIDKKIAPPPSHIHAMVTVKFKSKYDMLNCPTQCLSHSTFAPLLTTQIGKQYTVRHLSICAITEP